MQLKDYNYDITDNARFRHRCLGKAVKGHGLDKVLNALYSRRSRAEGYKSKRLRADINYLKRRG